MSTDSFAGVDISVVENALNFIASDDRELWVAMGMAIKSEFGDAGFSAWDAWSASAKSYKAKTAKDVWKSIKYSGRTGIGSLFHEAKSSGFKFEQQELSAEDKKKRDAEIKRRETERKQAMAAQKALDMKWHRKIASVAKVLAGDYLVNEGKSEYLDKKQVRAYGLLFVQYGFILITDDNAVDVEIVSGSDNITAFFNSERKEACRESEDCSFLYVKAGSVAVPMRDRNDDLVNLQFIFASGEKFFLKHGQKQRTFHVIGAIDKHDRIGFVEGYSTGVSFFSALTIPGVIAFDSGNLLPVAKIWRERRPDAEIIIGGDDDHHLGDKNTGRKKASEAAGKVAGKVVFPGFIDAQGRSDFNDMVLEQGADAVLVCVNEQLAKYCAESPPPASAANDEIIDPASDFSLSRVLSDFVVLHGQGSGIFDNKRCEFMSVGDLRNSLGNKVANDFLNNEHRKVILRRNVVFDPVSVDLPPAYINLYRGLPLTPEKGDCQLLLDILFYLCEQNEEVYDWMLKWIAFPLQNIGAKMTTAVVIHGREGAGKNLFWTAVQRIYGEYTSIITQTELESSFNGWASRKLFVIGNEVVSRQEMFHKKGVMRNMITEPEWYINEKNIKERIEPNRANFVFFSNFLQPVAPDKDDRRYLVLWTPPKKDKDYYKRAAYQRDHGGTEAFYHYLLNYDLGDFDEYTEPLMTEAKADLIHLSMKSDERFIETWLLDDLPVPVGPVLTSGLYDAYKFWCKREGEKFYVSSTEFGTLLNKHELVKKRTDQWYLNGARKTRGAFAIPLDYEKPDDINKSTWLSRSNDEFNVYYKDWMENQ